MRLFSLRYNINHLKKNGLYPNRIIAQLVMMLISGSVICWIFEQPLFAMTIWIFACIFFLGLLFYPSIIIFFDQFINVISTKIGIILRYLLFVPLFYLVFGTGRIIGFMNRRDLMLRKWDVNAKTYWVDRTPNQSIKKNYFKLY